MPKVHSSKCDFYVYAYFRLDGTPCYIGKGRGSRSHHHLTHIRRVNPHLKNIIRNAGGDLPVAIIRDNLTESEAFETEVAFIAAIGRKPAGPLVNFTDGGEGASGYIFTQEQRARLSVAQRKPDTLAKNRSRSLGKKHTEEFKAALRAIFATPEYREKQRLARRGHKLSDEHKEKLRQARLGYVHTELTKERIGAAQRTPQARANASAKSIGRRHRPDVKVKMAETTKTLWSNPEYSERVRVRIAASWAEPGFRERTRAARSEAQKRRHARERAEKDERQGRLFTV